jgi:ferredoxin-NADP reductase
LTGVAADAAAQPVVLLAGGIGITPFRAMLRHLAQARSAREVTLVYANRTPQAAAFLPELPALAAVLPGLRLVHCMSEPEQAQPAWTGERGFVTESLLARHLPDPLAPLYYVVGPPAMTEALTEALVNFGVADEAVRIEAFAGY